MTIHEKVIRRRQMSGSGDLSGKRGRRVITVVGRAEVEMVVVDIFVIAFTEPEGVGRRGDFGGLGIISVTRDCRRQQIIVERETVAPRQLRIAGTTPEIRA